MGLGLGLIPAGWLGGLWAWAGFTLPFAVLMVLASSLLSAHPSWMNGGWVHGLMVAAAVLVPNGWIGLQQFLAGYGAAQVVPEPMFSFAAFLGFALQPGLQGIAGSAMALIALFSLVLADKWALALLE